MDLEEFSEKFSSLPPRGKIKFIYTQIDMLREEEQIRFLLSILKDKSSSPIVQATALKFLRQTSYQGAEIFEQFRNDHFLTAAKAAKRALRDRKSQEKKDLYIAESVLRKLAGTRDKQKRLKILRAVSRLKASWVSRVMLDTLSDPCERIRDFIIADLREREELSLDIVLEKLGTPPWYVKSSALRILGMRRNPAAVKFIEKVMKDPNTDVRRCAAQALGEIGGKEVTRLLVKLAKDESPYVRAAADEALRKVREVRFS